MITNRLRNSRTRVAVRNVVAGVLLMVPVGTMAQSVVVNEYTNGAAVAGDTIELLVIQDNLDMRGMIIKDYSSNNANDGGGRFTFTTNALWSSVRAGTLIVLPNDTTATDVTVGGSDFGLNVGMQNTTYFTVTAGFDLATQDMAQIKASGSGLAGSTGAIHTLCGQGTPGAQYTGSPTPKIFGGNTGGGLFCFATNTTSRIGDYNNGTGGATGGSATGTLGAGNNATNTTFITFLRGTTTTAGTNVTSVSFDANWGSLTTATSYRLDVATDSGFTSLVPGYNNLNVGNVTTAAVTGLSASTNYFVRVRGVNVDGTTSTQSNTTTVTTTAGGDTTPPTVAGVAAVTDRTIDVTFNEAMGTGVTTTTNYSAAGAGIGTLTANPDSVVLQSGNTYRLTWNSPKEMLNGSTVTVTVSNAQDVAGNTIAGSNSGNTTGIGTAPTFVSLNRNSPNPSNAASVDYTATFSESVTGTNAANFSIFQDGTLAGASVANVSCSGVNRCVLVSTGTGSGDLRLDLANAAGIADLAGNALSTSSFTGQTYTIDRFAPIVASLVRDNTNPTGLGQVSFSVNMSEAVIGGGNGNFSLDTTGVSGASIAGTTNNGSYLTVLVNTGTGDGTVSVDLANSTGLTDAAGNAVTAPYNAGEVYTVDKTNEFVTGIVATNTTTTNASTVHYDVTFNEPVTGVDASIFSLNTSGVSGASVSGVAGGPTVYDVTVNTGSGDGTIRLDQTAGGSVADQVGNTLVSTFTTGSVYSLDRTNPTANAPTDAGQFTNNTSVTFNWTAPSDGGSGVASTRLQVGTTPGGNDIFDAVVAGTSQLVTGADGQTLYARLVVTDNATNVTTTGNSDGIQVDTGAPTAAGTSNAAIAHTAPFTVNFTGAGDGGSGLAQVELWAKEAAGGTWTATGLTSTSASGTFNYSGFAGDNAYFFATVASDNAGNTSAVPTGSGSSTTTWDPDSDGDSLYNSVENGAPNGGDGNNDLTADRSQPHVASFPNAADGDYVTLVASPGKQFQGITTTTTLPGTPPASTNFPIGIYGFTLTGVTAGNTETVQVILETPLVGITRYFKYTRTAASPSTPVWWDFVSAGTPGATITSGSQFELRLTDGADGDDDRTANGTIVDPGGPTPSPTSVGDWQMME